MSKKSHEFEQKVLSEPVDIAGLRALADEDGELDFIVEVELDEIIENSVDGLNDLVSSKLSEEYGHGLEDISYDAVGAVSEEEPNSCVGGKVLLRVHASFDWSILGD